MMGEELSLAPLLNEVARLRASATGVRSQEPMLDEALSSLEQSVEELQVASEELQVKNEELLLALGQLDDERRRYRDLFDLALDGHAVTDTEHAVVEANRAMGDMTGRPAESLIGCRFPSLF